MEFIMKEFSEDAQNRSKPFISCILIEEKAIDVMASCGNVLSSVLLPCWLFIFSASKNFIQ